MALAKVLPLQTIRWQVNTTWPSNMHGGQDVTITVEGTTEDDDVEFTQAMDFGDGRTMHTRAMDANEDGDVSDRSRDRQHRH